MNRFRARLDKLPPPQQLLWNELGGAIPLNFVLYGGTALTLRLAHRTSVDFDFFSSDPFEPGELLTRLPWRNEAQPIQSSPNTLSVIVDRSGPVRLSFFGNLSLGRVADPEAAAENGLLCASLLDLAGTKLKALHDRAEAKDYIDIAALLEYGLKLPQMLAAGQALYGELFNIMITLKALNYFEDGDLRTLPHSAKQLLVEAAVGVHEIPEVSRVSNQIAP